MVNLQKESISWRIYKEKVYYGESTKGEYIMENLQKESILWRKTGVEVEKVNTSRAFDF